VDTTKFRLHNQRVKLRLARFEFEHLGEMNSWLRARDVNPATMSELPAIGYIVKHEDKMVATAFLRKIEGDIGLFDGLATNPAMASEIRHHAIELLIKKVFKIAAESGMNKMIAYSKDNSIFERAEINGFTKTPYVLLTKEIK